MSNLDNFLDQLQEDIFDEARDALGEKGFDRWRNPKYVGRMEDAQGSAAVLGECGDTMEIYLKFKQGRVSQASYFTDGCASSGVAGSFGAELCLDRTPEELTEITADTVMDAVGKLPEEDQHCAGLAARTVQAALDDYMGRLVKKEKP